MRDELQSESARSGMYELLGLMLVLAAAAIIFREAFLGFFVQDDFGWLCESRFRNVADYLRSFFRFNNARSYRPLSQETFFLVFQKLFGLWPPAFHAMSLVCHLAASILCYRLMRKFASPLPALAGTLFFTVHSAHFRSVYWIAAIPEPMALVCYLASLICFIRFDREGGRGFHWLSILGMVLGIFCKESILSLPIVIGAYCVLFSRTRLLYATPHFALAALYGILRTLSRSTVDTAPYKLAFGLDAWHNLLAYLSWTANFSETLLKLKLKWDIAGVYPLIAVGLVLVAALLVMTSKQKMAALLSVIWYLAAIQPVLYFRDHIFSYYLAPALAAVALLISTGLEGLRRASPWKIWIPVPALCCFCLWSSYASVKREGRWWNERSFAARDILLRMPEVVRKVPPDRLAFLFGFGELEFGAMQNDAAFHAFGISPYRFLLVGLDYRTPGQIEVLRQNGGIRDYYCFLYSRGDFVDWTSAFHENPTSFVLIQPLDRLDRLSEESPAKTAVGMEVSTNEIVAGSDSLTIRVRNLKADAVDVLYTLDGRLMPALMGWPLDGDYRSTVFVGASTRGGDYHYRAIRNSNETDIHLWHPLDVHIRVKTGTRQE